MPRYKRGHIRAVKPVRCTRKSHRCNICGVTIIKGSPAYARNPRFLGNKKEYEHNPRCPEIKYVYGCTETNEEKRIWLQNRYVINSKGCKIVFDENMNAI